MIDFQEELYTLSYSANSVVQLVFEKQKLSQLNDSNSNFEIGKYRIYVTRFTSPLYPSPF